MRQHGYSFIELSMMMVVAGLTGAVAVPNVIEIADRAEYVTLQYARATTQSALETAHAVGLLRHSKQLSLEGNTVNLRAGYPVARADELQKLVRLEGFTIDNLANDRIAIYSTYRTYCFLYTNNGNSATVADVSEIRKTSFGTCE